MNFVCIQMCLIVFALIKGMAGGEERLADTPWWSGGATDDMDESFRYPPDLLGTSWGSYLASLPPTARASGRRVVLADGRAETQSDENKRGSPLRGSPKRSILRTKDSSTPAAVSLSPTAAAAETRRSQPHSHLLQRLSTSLRRVVEALAACGIEITPLSRASGAIAKLQTLQEHQRDGSEAVTLAESGVAMEEGLEIVLEALASQAKLMEEHAMSLRHTGAVLARNQQQFAREQREMQQTIEAAFSHIVAQQVLKIQHFS